jgi:hypothetical protein
MHYVKSAVLSENEPFLTMLLPAATTTDYEVLALLIGFTDKPD